MRQCMFAFLRIVVESSIMGMTAQLAYLNFDINHLRINLKMNIINSKFLPVVKFKISVSQYSLSLF